MNKIFIAIFLASLCVSSFSSELNDPVVPTPLGTFSSLLKSEQSGDCSGYEIRLWKLPHGKLIGTMTKFDGPCVAKAAPIFNGHIDDNGSMEFDAASVDESDQYVWVERVKAETTEKRISGSVVTFSRKKTEAHLKRGLPRAFTAILQ